MAENTPEGDTWYVRRAGRVAGPFSTSGIRHYVVEGRLTLEDRVSPDRSRWRELGQIRALVPIQLREEGRETQAALIEEESLGRRNAKRNLLVVALVLGALLMTMLISREDSRDMSADCASAPAAGVVWSSCRKDGANYARAELGGAVMDNISFINADLSGVQMTGADLRYANLAGVNLSYADLSAANLKGANLRGADLTNAVLEGADLSHTDLTGARVGGAGFAGANWYRAIWTDGSACAAGRCPAAQ